MASTALRPPPVPNRSVLAGPLVLAAALFVATICACVAILWLLDRDSEPGPWTVVLAVAAVAATIVSAYAESSWSARVTRTTELGNATRLFAVGSVLLLIPTVLLQIVAEETEDTLDPRGISAACPEEGVPDTGFDDLEAGSDLQRLASCMRWWGLLAPDVLTFGPGDTVLRAEMATYLDRLAAAGGAPLPEAPGLVPPDPASPHAGAITRVSGAGIFGAGDLAGFAPGSAMTRDQLSATIARTHERVTGSTFPIPQDEHFSDLAGNSLAADIEAVAVAGIAVGGDDGMFGPAEPVTRAQVATVMARTLDLWVSEDVVSPPA